jgi:hypothetical protein
VSEAVPCERSQPNPTFAFEVVTELLKKKDVNITRKDKQGCICLH